MRHKNFLPIRTYFVVLAGEYPGLKEVLRIPVVHLQGVFETEGVL
jgi:hypothetical protein